MDDGNVMALFAKMYIKRATKDDHFKLKEAEAKWEDFVDAVDRSVTNIRPKDLIKPPKRAFKVEYSLGLREEWPWHSRRGRVFRRSGCDIARGGRLGLAKWSAIALGHRSDRAVAG